MKDPISIRIIQILFLVTQRETKFATNWPTKCDPRCHIGSSPAYPDQIFVNYGNRDTTHYSKTAHLGLLESSLWWRRKRKSSSRPAASWRRWGRPAGDCRDCSGAPSGAGLPARRTQTRPNRATFPSGLCQASNRLSRAPVGCPIRPSS